ncbi:hypothetical protein ACFXP3_09865 [Streptomyces sp. NPDC059096]|uniref:hypothetical protein n=1 Tax=Streptomyces sp. NPDC059096 TaxID=3346727 RepID=UPI0036A006A0
MRPGHRLLAGVLAAGALLTAGCAQSVDPIERLGRKAAERVAARDARDAHEAREAREVREMREAGETRQARRVRGVRASSGAPEPVARAVVVRRECGRPAPQGRTGARAARCRGAVHGVTRGTPAAEASRTD